MSRDGKKDNLQRRDRHKTAGWLHPADGLRWHSRAWPFVSIYREMSRWDQCTTPTCHLKPDSCIEINARGSKPVGCVRSTPINVTMATTDWTARLHHVTFSALGMPLPKCLYRACWRWRTLNSEGGHKYTVILLCLALYCCRKQSLMFYWCKLVQISISWRSVQLTVIQGFLRQWFV